MTYFSVLFTFILPPIILLLFFLRGDFFSWLKQEKKVNLLYYQAIFYLVLIALLYTTPWDNYLVANRVWWYDPKLVSGVVFGYVPLEEYIFFILQTVLTGLWTAVLMKNYVSPALDHNEQQHESLKLAAKNFRSWLGMLILIIWLGACLLWIVKWQAAVYLALILVWGLIPVLIQVLYGADILFNYWRVVLLGIGIPTLYLWFVDSVAITMGTWTIDPLQTTGIKLGHLPIEEMIFFALTNTLIVIGFILIVVPESHTRLQNYVATLRGAVIRVKGES